MHPRRSDYADPEVTVPDAEFSVARTEPEASLVALPVAAPAAKKSIFREQALQAHAGTNDSGDILRVAPVWMRWGYGILVLTTVAALLYSIFGRVAEYGAGPAVVKATGRVDLTARSAGIVTQIHAQAGQVVQKGDVLAQLNIEREQSDYTRAEDEYQLALVTALRDAHDLSLRSGLATLKTQRDLARARLDERTLRAPMSGVVSDVVARLGQSVAPGDALMALVSGDDSYYVIALLPGHLRPLLAVGMPLRFQLTGLRHAAVELEIQSIGDELIGPTEVQRYLGKGIGDTIPLTGPSIVVSARLRASGFVLDGTNFNWYEGMQGVIEARLRSRRIIVALFPGLETLRGNAHE